MNIQIFIILLLVSVYKAKPGCVETRNYKKVKVIHDDTHYSVFYQFLLV